MAVNGGGGVTLQFQRSPLKAITRTTFLPWNQIVVINPVVMTPFGGAGISWDEEDTSLRVSTKHILHNTGNTILVYNLLNVFKKNNIVEMYIPSF